MLDPYLPEILLLIHHHNLEQPPDGSQLSSYWQLQKGSAGGQTYWMSLTALYLQCFIALFPCTTYASVLFHTFLMRWDNNGRRTSEINLPLFPLL